MAKSRVVLVMVTALVISSVLLTSSCALFNSAPEITSLTSSSISVNPGGNCTVACSASDPDGDTLIYEWTASDGAISGGGSSVTWIAPTVIGSYQVSVAVSDGHNNSATESITIPVINTPPVIVSVVPSETNIPPEGSCTVTCTANDADGDPLSYQWTANDGEITGSGSAVTWQAPEEEGNYNVSVTVSDGKGGTDSDSCVIEVEMKFGSLDIDSTPTGAMVFLDGEDTGSITPLVINNLEPGQHTVKLTYFHHKDREQTVLVKPDETTNLNWSLNYAADQMVTIQPGPVPGKDATVDIFLPDTNYGVHYEIAAGRAVLDTLRTYIQFNLDEIPDDVIITDADLGLYYYESVGGSLVVEVGAYRVLQSWNEGGITWNNQPNCANTPRFVRAVPAAVSNGFVYWSLDDLVIDWLDGTVQNYGVMLRAVDESVVQAWKGFYSSDAIASELPKLTVHYYDPNP